NINGVFSPVGTTATYDAGDSFGWDVVSLGGVVIGQTYTLSANVTDQCARDLAAWSIPSNTPCQLSGVEIGIEGFQFAELDVNFQSYTFITAAGDFTISASPSSLSVYQGSSGSTTITLSSVNGFSGTVSLSSSAPSGLSVSSSPSSCTVPSNGSCSSTSTISAAPSMATGTYTVTVTGTSGSLVHSVSISVTVPNAPAIAFVAAVPVTGVSSSLATTAS